MRCCLLIFLMVVLCIGTAVCSPIGGEGLSEEAVVGCDEILLKDGNLLKGTLIREGEDFIVFETESLGRLKIPVESIEKIARAGESLRVLTDPDQNSIMFCPTSATLPKGKSYFRDIELFFLNFGYGVTDNFDLSLGTLFPLSADLFMLSLGGKLRLIDRDVHPLGLALTASYTMLDGVQLGTVGAVVSMGDSRKSLNLAVNFAKNEDSDSETIYLVGADIQTSRRTKIFAEYIGSSLLLLENSDVDGFINIGFRIFGERHSFSMGGFRPLGRDGGSFFALPMVMYSHHW